MKSIEIQDPAIPLRNHPLALTNFMLESGIGLDVILAGASIEQKDLTPDNDYLISYKQYSRLVENSIAATGNQHLGLAFGQYLGVSAHGLVGIGALACPTLWSGVQVAMNYKNAVSPITSTKLSTNPEGDTHYLTVEAALDAGALINFFVEVLCSVFSYSYKFLTAKQESPISYYFNQSEPKDLSIFTDLLGSKVYFGAHRNEMSCSVEALNKPMPLANATTAAETEKAMEDRLVDINQKICFLDAVRNSIVNDQNQFLSLDVVAEKLHFSPTTLKRKLNKHNSSFQFALDEVRKHLAIEYLTKKDMSITHTAQRLGFNDTTNFRRAFKKWTGITPSEFKVEK